MYQYSKSFPQRAEIGIKNCRYFSKCGSFSFSDRLNTSCMEEDKIRYTPHLSLFLYFTISCNHKEKFTKYFHPLKQFSTVVADRNDESTRFALPPFFPIFAAYFVYFFYSFLNCSVQSLRLTFITFYYFLFEVIDEILCWNERKDEEKTCNWRRTINESILTNKRKFKELFQ